MGSNESVWGNALFFTALGSAIILAAAFGRTLGNTPAGRKVILWSPAILALIVSTYVVGLLLLVPAESAPDCIYDSAHPSNCRDSGSPSGGGRR